jgi:hypothetical protein
MASPEGVVRTVSGYFTEGHRQSDTRPRPPGKIGGYHRIVSTYLNALTDAVLILERVTEPRAPGSLAERRSV